MPITSQSPVPCPGHGCGCHALLTGVPSLKNRIASSRQAPLQPNRQMPSVSQMYSHSGFGAPGEDCLPVPSWSPQLSSTHITWIPFLRVIPSGHQNLRQHGPKQSFPSNPKATWVPISQDATQEGVPLGVASPHLPHTYRKHTAPAFQKVPHKAIVADS